LTGYTGVKGLGFRSRKAFIDSIISVHPKMFRVRISLLTTLNVIGKKIKVQVVDI